MNKLKELRKKQGISQKEFSKLQDIPLRTLQSWENGESQIKQKKAKELADFFGVRVGYLLGYESNTDFVSSHVLQAIDNIEKLGITDYEEIEAISEAEKFIEKFLNDPNRFEKYQQTKPLGLSLIIKYLIEFDSVHETDFANLVLNFQLLQKSDQNKIIKIIELFIS